MVGIVAITIVLTAILAIGLQYYFTRAMAIDAARDKYQLAAENTASYIESEESRGMQLTELLARYPSLMDTENQSVSISMRDLFAEVMLDRPIFYSIYIGFPNGDFYEVINLDNGPGVREGVGAKPTDRWAVNRVRHINGIRQRELYFYNSEFSLQHQRTEPTSYDVRERQWFIHAKHDQATRSEPYLFQYTQHAGKTFSVKIPGSEAVLAIDVTLDAFSHYLRQTNLGDSSEVYVYTQSGQTIASSTLKETTTELPAVSPLTLSDEEKRYIKSLGTLRVSNEIDWPPVDFAVAGQPRGYSVDMIRLLSQMLEIDIQFINGFSWPELVTNFQDKKIDLLHPVFDAEHNHRMGSLTEPLLTLPFSVATHKNAQPVASLDELSGTRLAIPSGWAIIDTINTHYPSIEVVSVADTKTALELVSDRRVDSALDADLILRYTASEHFIDNLRFGPPIKESGNVIPDTLHILVPERFSGLTPLLNRALSAASDSSSRFLKQKWLTRQETSLSTVPYKALMEATENPGHIRTLTKENINGKPHFVYVDTLLAEGETPQYFAAVVPASTVLSDSLDKLTLSTAVTFLFLLFLVPISWVCAHPVVRPIHQLHSKSEKVKERQFDQVSYCPSRITELGELSSSMVDMAQAIGEHEARQRELMDSFIQLIAQAIDDKSPYTGGHCARVPELGLMLADAAHKSNQPPFDQFKFANSDEHREFKIAAWLHDCGKVTVPEHIVDKGSKLEVIYNRIHEIRTRFEVLWRDAELHYYRQLSDSPEREKELADELTQTRKRLQDDFTFVAHTNVGGEFLDDAAVARIKEIAEITWTRHFDNRLGLSPDEERHLSTAPEPLPAEEPLLADKPDHIVPRTRNTEYPPHLGIAMKAPKNLYNQGEVYNLCISRGTLTPEDRFIINEHIIGTIKMLDQLPFPPELSRVPHYASTHHEAMNGKGYPRGWDASQLTIPDRILIVADIFEALTASDRPYKKAKPLSVSLAILHKMVKEGHVDQDTFELFLTSGVYMDYARRYLPESQIDEVNIQDFLGQ